MPTARHRLYVLAVFFTCLLTTAHTEHTWNAILDGGSETFASKSGVQVIRSTKLSHPSPSATTSVLRNIEISEDEMLQYERMLEEIPNAAYYAGLGASNPADSTGSPQPAHTDAPASFMYDVLMSSGHRYVQIRVNKPWC